MSAFQNMLTPSISWYQNDDYVIVQLNISQLSSEKYKILENSIYFEGNNYLINLDLLHPIIVDESRYDDEERYVKFTLKKSDNEKWIRLTKDKNQYKSNIKVNWDQFEDSDEELSNDESSPMGGMDFSQMMQGMGGGGMDFSQMMQGMGGDGGMDFSQMMQGMEGMNFNNNEENEDEQELEEYIEDDEENSEVDDVCQECA